MGDRKNPQDIAPNDVGNVVGEDPQINAPIASRSEPVQLRMIGDPQDATIHLILEASAQSGSRVLVVRNGIEELFPCGANESDVHGIKRLSAARITSR